MVASVAVLFAAAGCSVGEAVADGVYGGISETVATVVRSILLGDR